MSDDDRWKHLDEFRAAYEADDNHWWRTEPGEHQNVFEDACERIADLADELERLRAELARVRPVVDAAVAWAEVWAAGSVADDERRALLLAVGRLWNETQGTGQ